MHLSLCFICCRNMYCVWRAYLEGTVQATQSRISTCENYKVQVADPAKTVRLQKEQQLRKVSQVLSVASVQINTRDWETETTSVPFDSSCLVNVWLKMTFKSKTSAQTVKPIHDLHLASCFSNRTKSILQSEDTKTQQHMCDAILAVKVPVLWELNWTKRRNCSSFLALNLFQDEDLPSSPEWEQQRSKCV